MILLVEARRLRAEASRALARDDLASARECALEAQRLAASPAGERLAKIISWLASS